MSENQENSTTEDTAQPGEMLALIPIPPPLPPLPSEYENLVTQLLAELASLRVLVAQTGQLQQQLREELQQHQQKLREELQQHRQQRRTQPQQEWPEEGQVSRRGRRNRRRRDYGGNVVIYNYFN